LTKLQLHLLPAATQNSRKRRKAETSLHLLYYLLLHHRACQVHTSQTGSYRV